MDELINAAILSLRASNTALARARLADLVSTGEALFFVAQGLADLAIETDCLTGYKGFCWITQNQLTSSDRNRCYS